MRVHALQLGVASLVALGAISANAAVDDAKALGLMKAGGCSVCHSPDKKLIGPAYKEVALKHKGEADALAKLEKSVRNGSKDLYGKIPMPPTPASTFSDADLRQLLQWVMTR